ncbi:NINE protein [Myxococcota bacterium]|nr:NINE protein [Myxococcota bacterium]
MSGTALATRKDTGIAYMLWVAGLFGFAGLHRIYMGRYVSGVLWLFTGGLCFVGQVIDLLMMPQMIEDSAHGRGW